MMWDEWLDDANNFNEAQYHQTDQDDQDSHANFDFLSLLAKPKVIIVSVLVKFYGFCWELTLWVFLVDDVGLL